MSNYIIQGKTIPSDRDLITEGVPGATKDFQSSLTAPLTVKRVRIMNLSASQFFLQTYDSASTPADGAAARFPQPVNPGDAIEYTTDQSQEYKSGLYVCASSTADTKTLIGTNGAKIEVDLVGAR